MSSMYDPDNRTTSREDEPQQNSGNEPQQNSGNEPQQNSGNEPRQNDADDGSFREYWRKELHADEEHEKAEQEARNEQYWEDMDSHGFRNTTDPNYGPIPEEYESNAMSRAAYGCGIVSIICIFFSMVFFGGSFVVGALGILFALLSRRNRFNRQARHAIRMCAVGMGITVATVLLAIAVVVESGMWGTLMKRISEIDPNDPNSVTVVQQELTEDLMKQYGLSGSGLSGYEAGGNSDGTASDIESSSESDASSDSADGSDEII